MSTAPLLDDADPTYNHFARKSEFIALLERFLSYDLARRSTSKEDEVEEGVVASLGAILDYYLPLPGLLDPSLDVIVPPLMEALAANLHALESSAESTPTVYINPKRLARLGRVLNWVVKVRGWKAVVPHFPSSIPNLPMLVTLLSPPTSPSTSATPITPHHPLLSSQAAWELRAVLLLWLALLLTVPFSLSALSTISHDVPSATSFGIDLPAAERLFQIPLAGLTQQVTLLAVPLLQKPGKEGAYAALVLARLFSREDAVQGLPGLFAWAAAEISEGEIESEANLVASIFELLAMLPSLLAPKHLHILHNFIDDQLLTHLRGSKTAATSGLIRKLAVKAKGRVWLAALGKGFQGDEEEFEPPEGLEEQLDDLMGGLSDKDTVVRYSCAKYLARLSALLPQSFSSQIVLATTNLFAGTDTEPIVETSFGTIIDPGGSATTGGTMGFGGLETTRGEARWHGVCLALAEMARRGLINGEAVQEAVNWVVKALTFDLRRASHSIGSNVRDAAAYLVWSLSRACAPPVLAPFAEKLATNLACVAVFDREVGVRRAASAAFQEGVGRLGLFPEGIDVLAKTDFYSVSVRRLAFTIAAPAVGVHRVYRDKMREHLHHITLRHWDTAMRIQAASALKSLLKLGKEDLDDSIDRELRELPSLDAVNIHGALAALGQLILLVPVSDPRRQKVFDALSTIRPAALVSQQAADILTAVCELNTAALNETTLATSTADGILSKFLDLAMKRREPEVHEALAGVYGRLSELRDPNQDVNKLIGDLKSFRISQRQAATLALGHIRYSSDSTVDKAVKALLQLLEDPVKMDVESRRWAVKSLADIAVQKSEDTQGNTLLVSPQTLRTILKAILCGLNDYTTDQRGDVGSWVRIASLQALSVIIPSNPPYRLCQSSDTVVKGPVTGADPIDSVLFISIMGGIIKQSVEKLESVRGAAAMALAKIRESGWTWDGMDALVIPVQLLQDESQGFRYIDAKEWFASAMPLLKTGFRSYLVAGLAHSIGSQIVSLSEAALRPLVSYLTTHEELVQPALQDLLALLTDNYSSNRVFIPTLQFVHRLFGGGILAICEHRDEGADVVSKVLGIGCKNIGGIKAVERISTAMRIVIVCLSSSERLRKEAIDKLPLFLTHRFPRIRAIASEELYLALSTTAEEHDTELDTDLEEVLLETDWVGSDYVDQAERVVSLLSP